MHFGAVQLDFRGTVCSRQLPNPATPLYSTNQSPMGTLQRRSAPVVPLFLECMDRRSLNCVHTVYRQTT
jgi:hypothetical protein